MVIVTGGAGLIGSNVVAALNARGISDILVVDHMKDGHKMFNLASLETQDYLDKVDFLELVEREVDLGTVDALFHLGACSATTEWDGEFVMRNNFEYSKKLLHWCQRSKVPYFYASSASVYGLGRRGFVERRDCEMPINMYAYSKFQFDQYVRAIWHKLSSQVVGFRYFNVYGPGERHKHSMASTAYHFNQQLLTDGVCRLFSGTGGYSDGEQKRDFVYVEDAAAVNLWFLEHEEKSGIFNVGTGIASTFNEVASTAIRWHEKENGVKGTIEYIPFPTHLEGVYQNYTQADLTALRHVGCDVRFRPVAEGVMSYLDVLNKTLES